MIYSIYSCKTLEFLIETPNNNVTDMMKRIENSLTLSFKLIAAIPLPHGDYTSVCFSFMTRGEEDFPVFHLFFGLVF